jgi:hypothetical protein
MKIIAKISVFTFLLCQLTSSFAFNSTINVDSENEPYMAVWFVQEGNELIEINRMELEAKYINEEGATLEDQVDMKKIQELFKVKEVSEECNMKGKTAFLFVLNPICTQITKDQYSKYCLEIEDMTQKKSKKTEIVNGKGMGQCIGQNVVIDGWCIILDKSSAYFGCAVACATIEL